MSRSFASFLSTALVVAGAAHGADEVSYDRQVRPILSDRCFACHGFDAHERKGDLRLDQAEGEDGAYRTLDGSTAIVPGSPETSEVWKRILSTDEEQMMPPPDSHKEVLSEEEKKVIESWILQGAKYENFWAFVPPEKQKVPVVEQTDWSSNPIDLHVLERLSQEGLSPSPDAEKRTLIRRVTLDLTGLPPTPQEIQRFLGSDSPDSYERLVDELLARPQYGEHMGRYWLDLVRFADTNGMHHDYYRNHVSYRDWVIRAFNENLGYDDFLRYQLAGDLVEGGGDDALIASGFNRLHLIIDRGTALPEESYFKNVLDRVSAVGTAFMGLTVQCAQCHDHKYDPITQKDFYSLFAFFNNIDVEPETRGRERDGLQAPFIRLGTKEQEERLAGMDQVIAGLNQQVAPLKASLGEQPQAERKAELEAQIKELENGLNRAKKERASFDSGIPKAMVSKEREEIRPSFMMDRGQYDAPGEAVPRATPAFLPPLKQRADVASRLDLAEWFLAEDHPLTARVAVNRFWQQLFGVGLVKTSEDLGAQGEYPSHPGLLDHLAVSFVDSGWDIKALMKEIVMSRSYRQSSVADPQRYRKDPENRLLSRGSRFRMDAEMIRDQILLSSGLLSQKMYGRSVKPPQPDGLWKSVTMSGERFAPDQGEEIYRRSVYTFWKRAMPPPQMTILNAPIRDACISRRERTNTPSQALLLLNESEFMKAARKLAQQVLAEAELEDAGRVGMAYESITSRLPDAGETRIYLKLIGDLKSHYSGEPGLAADFCEGLDLPDTEDQAQLAAWSVFVNTLYNLDITKTRE